MCLLYALSAWGGYISIDNVGRLNKILRKAKRYGFTDSLLTFSELWEQSDDWRRSLLGRAGSCPPTFCSQWASHDVCPTTFCPTGILKTCIFTSSCVALVCSFFRILWDKCPQNYVKTT